MNCDCGGSMYIVRESEDGETLFRCFWCGNEFITVVDESDPPMEKDHFFENEYRIEPDAPAHPHISEIEEDD